MKAQAELFPAELFAAPPVPDQSQKIFRGANGVELPYWEEGGKIIRVALSDQLVLDVTNQKGGHIYAKVPVPGYRRLEKKTKISFLSQAAVIRRSLEINSSIESALKEQHRLLSAASEINGRSAAPVGGRRRDAADEFSHREFGPVITSFEGIEEYPLGTPSWLARRSELEWSRKSLYGQLRRWFGVIQTGCTVIKSNGRLGEQIGQSRKTVGEGLQELDLLRLIHVEGPPKGTRYVYFHWHPWIENPEAVPTWAKLGQVEQLPWPNSAQGLGPNSPMPWPKLGHKETSKDDKNKERVLAPEKKTPKHVPSSRSNQGPDQIDKATRSYCEEELLGLLGAIVRPSEILKHERMWRARIKTSHKAIIKAVRKYHGLSEENQKQIKNPAAWMTKQYRLFGGRSVAKTA